MAAISKQIVQKSPYLERISQEMKNDKEVSAMDISPTECAVMMRVWTNQKNGRHSQLDAVKRQIREEEPDCPFDVDKSVQSLIQKKMLNQTVLREKTGGEVRFVESLAIPSYLETTMEILWRNMNSFETVKDELSRTSRIKENAKFTHIIRGSGVENQEMQEGVQGSDKILDSGGNRFTTAEIRLLIKTITTAGKLDDNVREIAIVMLSLYSGAYSGMSRKTMAVGFVYAASQETKAGISIEYLSKFVRLPNRSLNDHREKLGIDRGSIKDKKLLAELKMMAVARAYKRIAENMNIDYIPPKNLEHLLMRG